MARDQKLKKRKQGDDGQKKTAKKVRFTYKDDSGSDKSDSESDSDEDVSNIKQQIDKQKTLGTSKGNDYEVVPVNNTGEL